MHQGGVGGGGGVAPGGGWQWGTVFYLSEAFLYYLKLRNASLGGYRADFGGGVSHILRWGR